VILRVIAILIVVVLPVVVIFIAIILLVILPVVVILSVVTFSVVAFLVVTLLVVALFIVVILPPNVLRLVNLILLILRRVLTLNYPLYRDRRCRYRRYRLRFFCRSWRLYFIH
jgi:hypothetical protein